MAGRPRFAAAPPEEEDDPGDHTAAFTPVDVEDAEPEPEPEPRAPSRPRAVGLLRRRLRDVVRPEPEPVEDEGQTLPSSTDAETQDPPPEVVPPEPLDGAVSLADAREAGTLDPQLTEEWALPAEEDHLDAVEEDAAHVQSASGAVDEPLLDPIRRRGGRRRGDGAAGARAAGSTAAHAGDCRARPPRPPDPGRGALIPAGAVVTVAAIGALAASGIFGGSDPALPVDTGIVPPRALQAVPEGEAAEVVDDLRGAAGDARRRRLADRRQALAAAQLRPEPEPEATDPEEDTAPEAQTPAPDDGGDTGDGAAGGGGGTGGGGTDATPGAQTPDAGTDAPDTGGAADEPTITGEVGGDAAP
jgi:hypothetical protein